MTDHLEDNQLGASATESAQGFCSNDSRTHRELGPNSNTYFVLYKAMGLVAGQVNGLEFSCDMAQRRLSLLENLPRHDVTIDDETWKAISDLRYDAIGASFDSIQRDLKLCVNHIQQAAQSTRGLFKAELKVKVEDRIQRHKRDTEALMAELNQLADEHQVPRQPYLIRQATLSAVLVDFAGTVEMSREFRNTLDPNGIHNQARAALTEQEAVVLRLKIPLAKWRDNPSQKMGDTLQDTREQLLAVVDELRKHQAAALYECKLAGVVIYNRAGRWNYLPDVQPRSATPAGGEVQSTTA